MPDKAIESSMFPRDLEALIDPRPVVEGVTFWVPVSASRLLKHLAHGLFEAMQQATVRDLLVTAEDVVEYFLFVLAARCAYVSGKARSELHPKDIEYPSFLFPVLSAIGRYADSATTVEIVPLPEIGYQDVLRLVPDSSEDPSGPFESEKVVINTGKKFRKPESSDKVLQTFRALGVQTVIGLPMEKRIEDDGLFRLTEAGDAILGGKTEPSVHQLYARVMIEIAYLASLYGQARVVYVANDAMKTCIYELISRHVRGHSHRLSS